MVARVIVGAFGLLALSAGLAAAQSSRTVQQSLDGDKLRPGRYVGRVLSPPGSDGAFSVEITSTTVTPRRTGRRVTYQRQEVRYAIDLYASAGVKVRVLKPPQEFTEKGDIKKYSRAELLELKGKDRHLPGFESSLAELRPGQVVRFTLANRAALALRSPDLDVPDFRAPSKRVVTLIVVLDEGS